MGEGLATVLVVDDNEDDREIYSRILYYNNFDVILASSAVEAVHSARSRRPDLILMDINLGDISGLAAAEFIRADPDIRSIPIVCFSSMDLSSAFARQCGCIELLQKPVSADVLVGAIRRRLSAAATEPEPP
jgi:two-component system cell cycle response regulator DivK